MDTITLPMVESDMSLQDALIKMRQARRSGIVWQRNPKEFVLYTAARVVIEKSKRKAKSLGDLQGEPIDIPDIGTIANATPEPFIGLEELFATLRSPRTSYGLLAAGLAGDYKKALLFTIDPNAREKLESGPADCFCPACDRAGAKGTKCPIHKVLLVCGEI